MLFLLVILRGKVTSFCRLHRPNSSQNKNSLERKSTRSFLVFLYANALIQLKRILYFCGRKGKGREAQSFYPQKEEDTNHLLINKKL